MPPTFPENDKIEILVGTTPKGVPLVIVPTQTGLYKIEYRGSGAAPRFTEQLFTSLLLAKRALENWQRANAASYAKEQMITKGIERRQQARKLKNGELETPEFDDEE